MGEIERRFFTPEKVEEEKSKRPPKDPTEWRPRDNRDWEQVDANVSATEVRSDPLNYGTLVGREEDLPAIEAQARGDLVRMMDHRGYTVAERAVRVHWRLVVEGYGYEQPQGFVHPEAPQEVKVEGLAAWKRVVEIASDSMTKFIFVKVWARRRRLGSGIVEIMGQLQASVDKAKADREVETHLYEGEHGPPRGIGDLRPAVEVVAEDDVVDAEVVEDTPDGG